MHCLADCLQAQPEVLFEATLAEGDPFKLRAAIADPSGFTNFDDDLLELEFRWIPVGFWMTSQSVVAAVLLIYCIQKRRAW